MPQIMHDPLLIKLNLFAHYKHVELSEQISQFLGQFMHLFVVRDS